MLIYIEASAHMSINVHFPNQLFLNLGCKKGHDLDSLAVVHMCDWRSFSCHWHQPAASHDATGPFISVLLSRLENLLENSIAVNLLVTGILAQLASYPQPLLRSFLFSTDSHDQSSVRTLHQVTDTDKPARTLLSPCVFISPLGACVARCWCPCTARLNASSQPDQIIQRWSLRPGDSCWSKTKTASFEVQQHTTQQCLCALVLCHWRKSLHWFCDAKHVSLYLHFTLPHYKVL